MTSGPYIQATVNLSELPLTRWQGLGVLAAWAAGAVTVSGLVLGSATRDRRTSRRDTCDPPVELGGLPDVRGRARRMVTGHGLTVCMVTHDPVAASYADRVVFLSDGRIMDQVERPSVQQIAARMASLEPAEPESETEREPC
jgi:hypothetical protein